jgi:hypothetical protein
MQGKERASLADDKTMVLTRTLIQWKRWPESQKPKSMFSLVRR